MTAQFLRQQRKAIRDFAPCAKCLFGLGFGAKSIAKRIPVSADSIKNRMRPEVLPERRKPWLILRRTNDIGKECGLCLLRLGYGVMSVVALMPNASQEKVFRWKRQAGVKTNASPRIRLRVLGKTRARISTKRRLSGVIRNRIHAYIRKGWKSASSEELLGCSFEAARTWIENQFTKRMTWENYGVYWQIDHIIPCAAFDLSKPDQQRRCFHYTNLRPLRTKHNLSKNAKVVPTQPELTLSLKA